MRVAFVVLVMLGTACHTWAESSAERAEKRLQAAAQVLQEIMAAPDKGIPEEVMEGESVLRSFLMKSKVVWCLEWPTEKVLQLAVPQTVGVLRNFLVLPVGVGALRSDSRAWITCS
jgi:hypothetical protein